MLNGLPPALRAPCIEIYARAASATKQAASARDLAGKDFREDDEAAKIELTHSTTSGINRVDPALGTLVVCIIQVTTSYGAVEQSPLRLRLLPREATLLRLRSDRLISLVRL
jgi:hypothetical protein